ncbi:MAG TPA: C25 family cysteine peptidase [Methanothrix sp.]|nr:C25 family cysteine peptidase [Methanothrix sp.]
MKTSLAHLLVLVMFLLLLTTAPAAGAPAKIDKTTSELAIEAPSRTADVRAVIYPCAFVGSVLDEETGDPIRGVAVTFVKDDDGRTWTDTTGTSGSYRVELPEGSYSYIATHKNYVMESNSPDLVSVRAPYTRRVGGAGGIVREITVTSESTREVDIEMEPRPRDILLVTTSLLRDTAALDDAVDGYTETVGRTDGLVARYIVLDSSECSRDYGVRVSDPTDWHEIRDALEAISEETGPAYIILLGGEAVIPRPEIVTIDSRIWYLPTDAWYVDFEDDGIVDEGFVVSRLADLSTESSGIVAALETAIDLHESGGYGLSPEVRFSTQCWLSPPIGLGDACDPDDASCGLCRATPPYGVCDECSRREETFDLISGSDYIVFMGHGSPESFSTNDHVPIFGVENVDDVDLETNHPVITGYVSCNTGLLYENRMSFGTEFLRAGAAAFVARNTEQGTPNYFAAHFTDYISGTGAQGTYRIGDALFELMRESVLRGGNSEKTTAAQLCIYGDPTLKRNPLEMLVFSRPAMTAIR